MLTFAFMHPPYLVRILFGMPSLHLFTFLMFLSLVGIGLHTNARLNIFFFWYSDVGLNPTLEV